MPEKSCGAEGIVESLPVGVIVVDQTMRIVCLNPAAQEYTGYAPPDVVGRRLPELFNPQLWAEESALQQAMETGKRVEPRAATVISNTPVANSQALQQDQQRLLVGAAPIKGEWGRAGEYLLSLQPASPLYQMEADRISDISHDMRGPLASILAYTELLVDEVDGGQPELRRQFLEVIEQRTRHLTDLIVNLTSLVRQDLGYLKMTKRQISLRDVTSAVLQTLQVQARQRDVRLTLEAGDDQHLVVGDRDALSTLLKNLISNAIKFSNAEGKVVVSLRRVGQNQILRVTDSGSGIRTEDLPHIFETFYRGQNAVAAGIEGSGLGLALVKAIAEAHNGEINVDSKEGEGTTITIALPAAEKGSPRPS